MSADRGDTRGDQTTGEPLGRGDVRAAAGERADGAGKDATDADALQAAELQAEGGQEGAGQPDTEEVAPEESIPGDQAIDLVLGEACDAAALRRRLGDPREALEVAETRDMVERFRELGGTVRASNQLRARLVAAAATRRRMERFRRPRAVPIPMFVSWGAAAAVAVVVMGFVATLENRLVTPPEVAVVGVTAHDMQRPDAPLRVAGDFAASGVLKVTRGHGGEVICTEWNEGEPDLPLEMPVPEAQDPQFHEIMARWSDRAEPSRFDQWVAADNNLAVLRQEFRNRFTPTARQRALELTGANPDLDLRIQSLAATVAERVDALLLGGVEGAADAQPAVSEVALALRGLLAAGSDLRLGDYRETVRRCAAWMEGRIREFRDGAPALGDAEMAVALAAMTDVAVCSGRYGELVREHAERLALRTVQGTDGQRPGLLQWGARPLALGDAGRLFRLAPAFGVRTSVVFRARMLVAAHLEERLAASNGDPALLAAQRYGFDDLVDRDAVDQKLRVWRASFLRPDYVAMHHLAWSQYPVRPGWARFQQELRGLAASPTPDGVGDPAALLLCLAMNFAAPGVSELVGPTGL